MTFYSTQSAKALANNNGCLAQEKGVAQKIYNLILFDIEQSDLSKYNSYHWEYWPLTKTLMLQNIATSKVSGIGQVLQYYIIEQPILYFGDGPNDLEIFKSYSDCICMGNCYPPLEKYAIFKTDNYSFTYYNRRAT